ncbi:MAG TPA: hypothetical protein VGD21_13680 [Lysobacter sp.]
MFFVVRTGGKEQGIDRLIGEAVAEGDAPEPVDPDRPELAIAQRAHGETERSPDFAARVVVIPGSSSRTRNIPLGGHVHN